MSKALKRYDEATGEWKIISAPDVSVIQQLESGSDISDTNVIITNPNYIEEDEKTTLSDTLSEINDDISRLQRNVSWLAEHGGGGGQGGGGSTYTFGIEVDTPNVENGGSVYLRKEEAQIIEVKFRITGGADGDIYKYTYQYDTDPQTTPKDIEVNKYVTIKLDNTNSDAKEHFLKIRAIHPYNTDITKTFQFTIYESSLSLSFGGTLVNNIFYITQNDTSALLPVNVVNGLVGSTTTLIAEAEGRRIPTEPFINEVTTQQTRYISFWDIIPKDQASPLVSYYVVKISGQATLANTTVEDEGFYVRVKIVDPSQITITMGANGNGMNDEPMDVEQGSSLNYNFRVYAPSSIDYLYYSAKIVNGNNSILILGKYYDDNTCIEDTAYHDNPSVKKNITVSSQYTLDPGNFAVGDDVELWIKVWSRDGSQTAEARKLLTIIDASKSFWPRQYEDRSGNNRTPNTLFASWNKLNVNSINPFVWSSAVHNYAYISDELERTEGHDVLLDMNVINGNNSSGLQSNKEVPFLRLQNHAYATVDFGKYYPEIGLLTKEGSQSFTISVTVEADEMAGTNHTIMLWGSNNFIEDTINNGIRIDAGKIYWAYKYETNNGQIASDMITCSMPQGVRTTIDFSYDYSENGSTVKIYKNGVLNAIKNIKKLSDSEDHVFPSTVYFGVNKNGDAIENYTDADIYEFSIYTKVLNDLQITVNSKNARLNGSTLNPMIISEYNDWLVKNFIPSPEVAEKLSSVFFENGKYINGFDVRTIQNIRQSSVIPTITLSFADDVGFDEESFYRTIDDVRVTANTYYSDATYYDPSAGQTEEIALGLNVSLQGTSTLLYRVKNLEIRMAETVTIDGQEMPVLFQPKPTWFPEKQFTLKADVVDSAHANNAVIGEWINTEGVKSGVFGDNPAMQNLTNETRPKDVDLSGNPMEHRSSVDNVIIDYDENVSIKHTLEGFPCLLFIKFSGKGLYSFVGIYSFNLGRYSHYNMGMKFLECFSRRDDYANMKSCPAIIRYYKEKNTLGNISASNVYSFEFDNGGNVDQYDYPMWAQDHESVVKVMGGFKYPEDISDGDQIWGKLQYLFQQTAQWRIDNYYGYEPLYTDESGDTHNIFYPMYRYTAIKEGDVIRYIPAGGPAITQNNDNYNELTGAINIQNAAAYFMIANAFGMTDSLGKNMTLRSWDGGNMWYTCFYDMDTALGVANDGTESILPTALTDKIVTVVNDQDMTTTIQTTFHDKSSQYAQHISKLWGILRSHSFLYAAGRVETPIYESIWEVLRRKNGVLSSPDKFTEIMEQKVNICGEIIFNYDYNSKYVAKPDDDRGDAVRFLHGTRVDYVRDWLRKHFYFLDGAFDSSEYQNIPKTSYDDSPYYNDTFTYVGYYTTGQRIAYTARVMTPCFLKIGVGNASGSKIFVDTENKDTTIYIPNSTSPNSQITIKGASLLSKLGGLQGGFQRTGTNLAGVVKSLTALDASSSYLLLEDPMGGTQAFIDSEGKSALESVNLSNTRLIDATKTYQVDLGDFTKLLSVDIRNSDVTSIVLPKSALDYLYLSNSRISDLEITDQSKLTTVNIDGCDRLNSITFEGCDGFTSLNISDKQNLATISITSCDSLEELTISSCTNLSTINILNNSSLKKIVIDNCTATNLSINILGSSLEDIRLSGIWTTKAIRLPAREQMASVTHFELNNVLQTAGIYYGNEEIETYDNSYVLDLSPMPLATGRDLIIRNMNVKYVRVSNDPNSPVDIYSTTFDYCNSLTRIFGHIRIMESAFYNKHDFFLNHNMNWAPNGMLTDYSNVVFDPSELYNTDFGPAIYELDGIKPLFMTGDYVTNLAPLTNRSIAGWFSDTNCDIQDAYYVLSLCESTVENLSNLFSGCGNITTDDTDFLDINTFAKCGNVTNINGIFRGCSIGGPLFQPLLEPLIENLTEFRNVFSGPYKIITELSFFPNNCNITVIEGFNPNVGGDALIDSHIFENLPRLTTIKDSFNNCTISFYGGLYDATELFKNNTELTEIINSFVMVVGYGSIANLFGGYDEGDNIYPSNLTTVAHSFIFEDGSNHDPDVLYDGDDGNGVLMPLGNSFFKRIAHSLRYVTGSGPGDNRTYDDNFRYGTSASFTGPGIRKFISNIESEDPGYPGMNDCGEYDFPYEIFAGCTNLAECPTLFENAHNYKNYDVSNDRETVININPLFKPNGDSLFKDCPNLQNISALFKGMSSAIHCTLQGDAFKGCELVNVDKLFLGSYVVGKIPFHLFYEEGEKTYLISGLTAAQATALGISDDEGDLFSIETGDYSVYTGTCKYGKNTIKSMSQALGGLNASSSMTCYSVANDEFMNTLCENDQYSDFEYVLNGLHYKRNENKNRLAWNRYAYDGSSDFLTRLQLSSVWSRSDIDKVNLPVEFIDTPTDISASWSLDNAKMLTGYNFNSQATANKFSVKNYFCPPDVFLYCKNEPSTNIQMALAGACGSWSNSDGTDVLTGAIGRIPEFFLEPVSEILSCAGLFSGNETMLPEKWSLSSADLGMTYPEGLFSSLSKVEDMSNVFSGTRIWKFTQVPATLFANNGTTLRNLMGLWSYAKWIESGTTYPQVPSTTFNSCPILQNVSNMFADSRGDSIATMSQLFTQMYNGRINNCSSFMAFATRTTGNVPTFWKDWTTMNGDRAFYGIVTPYSYDAMRAKFGNWERDVPLNYYTNQA